MLNMMGYLSYSGNSFRLLTSFSRSNIRKPLKNFYSTRTEHTFKYNKIDKRGYVMLIIPVGTFLLGSWQVQRRKWKLGLIAELQEKTNIPTVLFPEDLQDLEDLEYRKVKIVGEFDHSREIYLGPRPLLVSGGFGEGSSLMSSGQSGYNVITPFKLTDRDLTILVNRGWVPKQHKNPASRPEGQINGEVSVTGVVKKHENRGPFMPESGKGSEVFLYRDLQRMSEVTESSPIYVEAVETIPGGPQGSQTRITLRNEHLSYLITWYSLSLATSYLWFKKYVMRKPLM